MPVGKSIKTHLIRHMWEAYAHQMLVNNPTYIGVYHNKIKNFFIYDSTLKTEPRKVPVQYSDTVKEDGTVKQRKWNSTVHGSHGIVFSYAQFRKYIEQYFVRAKDCIIQGEALQINCVGKICAKRVQRDFRKKNQIGIDWGKTRKNEMVWSEELQKMVYPKLYRYTDDDWCRIAWFKSGIKNDSVYQFAPANASSDRETGFKMEFTEALQADPLLKYRYLYVPIKH